MLDPNKILKLGGREYVLRPSFKAFVKIQQKLNGERIVPLLLRISKQELGMEDVAIIAHALAEAGGSLPLPTFDEFAEMLVQEGGLNHTGVLMECLQAGCQGPKVEAGNAPAPGTLPG